MAGAQAAKLDHEVEGHGDDGREEPGCLVNAYVAALALDSYSQTLFT